jgi:hypothetical protein
MDDDNNCSCMMQRRDASIATLMIAARARSDQGQTFVEGFSRSWGDPQPGAFAPLFAPEIRLVAPLLPVTEGITAAEKAFKRIFAVFQGMRGDVHDWAPHPDGVFIDFTLSATLAGPARSLAPLAARLRRSRQPRRQLSELATWLA